MPTVGEVNDLLAGWHKVAMQRGSRTAIGDQHCVLTYGEVELLASELEAELNDAGVRAGEVVAISLNRCVGWLPAYLAVWKRGAVVLPLEVGNDSLNESCFRETGARWKIAAGSGDSSSFSISNVSERASLPDLPKIAYIMPTSGSLNEPKLAAVTHSSIAAVINGLSRIIHNVDDGPYLHSASFSFSSSLRQLFLPMYCGGEVHIYARPQVFDPLHLLVTAERSAATTLDLTPSHLRGLLHSEAGASIQSMLRSVKRVIVASEVFPPDLLHKWRFGVTPHAEVYHLYGQTETGGAISARRIVGEVEAKRPVPLALPFPPFEGHSGARYNDAAELVVTGMDPANGTIRERHFQPHESVSTLEGLEGYATGDLFRFESCEMEYAGRVDWQLKILGKRIDTEALERAVGAVDAVLSVAVIELARPDGEKVIAAAYSLVRETSPSAAAQAKENVEYVLSHKVSASVLAVQVQEVPLNRSGKVDRPALTRMLSDVLLTRKDRDGLSGLPPEVVETWNGVVPAHFRTDDQNFFLAGGDSIAMVSVLAAIYRATGVRIPPSEFLSNPTINGMRNILLQVAKRTPSEPPVLVDAREPLNVIPTPFQRSLWISERLNPLMPSPYWLRIDLTISSGSGDFETVRSNLRRACCAFDLIAGTFLQEGDDLVYHPNQFTHDQLVLDPDGGWREALESFPTLAQGTPLFRAVVLQQGNDLSVGLRVHHALADRKSLDLLVRAAFGYQDDSPLEPFRSFATESVPPPEMLDDARAYWSQRLPKNPMSRSGRPFEISRAAENFERDKEKGRRAKQSTTAHAEWLHAFNVALRTQQLELSNLIGIDVDLRRVWSPRHTVFGPAISSVPVVLNDGMDPEHVMKCTSEVLAYAFVPLSVLFQGQQRPTGDPKQPFFLYKMVYQKEAFPNMAFGKPVHYQTQPEGIPENDVTLFVRDFGDCGRLELAWNRHAIPDEVAYSILRNTKANYFSLGS